MKIVYLLLLIVGLSGTAALYAEPLAWILWERIEMAEEANWGPRPIGAYRSDKECRKAQQKEWLRFPAGDPTPDWWGGVSESQRFVKMGTVPIRMGQRWAEGLQIMQVSLFCWEGKLGVPRK